MLSVMELTFGQRLQAARKRAGYKSQHALGDRIGVAGRTIRNYEIGATSPDVPTLEKLTAVLGDFVTEGDPVETAVRSSELVKWRQDAVISTYEKHRYDQAREEAG
jgi:transcriptional regulator with XRE-family HTH domain